MKLTIPDDLWFTYISHNNSVYFMVTPQESKNKQHFMKMMEDAALTHIPDGGSNELFTLDTEGRTQRASTPLLTGGPLLGFSTYGAVHQLPCVSTPGMEPMDEKVQRGISQTI